jgi:BlaI family penicillinase repressor
MKISLITKSFSLFAVIKRKIMKTLTAKEEEIMGYFWDKGPLFVKQLLDFYDEPRPHFNTLSTIVRGLEEKGFLSHETFGNTYQYYAVVSRDDFKKKTLKGVISKYFNNSYLGAVSSLVKEEEISLDELKQLIRDVEEAHQ